MGISRRSFGHTLYNHLRKTKQDSTVILAKDVNAGVSQRLDEAHLGGLLPSIHINKILISRRWTP